jgi:hypothetical protein
MLVALPRLLNLIDHTVPGMNNGEATGIAPQNTETEHLCDPFRDEKSDNIGVGAILVSVLTRLVRPQPPYPYLEIVRICTPILSFFFTL